MTLVVLVAHRYNFHLTSSRWRVRFPGATPKFDRTVCTFSPIQSFRNASGLEMRKQNLRKLRNEFLLTFWPGDFLSDLLDILGGAVDGLTSRRLSYFSAHDASILNLQVALGMPRDSIIVNINTGSALLIELHRDSDSSPFYVQVIPTNNPEIFTSGPFAILVFSNTQNISLILKITWENTEHLENRKYVVHVIRHCGTSKRAKCLPKLHGANNVWIGQLLLS